jgi:hypothetical protein
MVDFEGQVVRASRSRARGEETNHPVSRSGRADLGFRIADWDWKDNHPGLKATPHSISDLGFRIWDCRRTNHPVGRSGRHPSFSKEGSFLCLVSTGQYGTAVNIEDLAGDVARPIGKKKTNG